jgi:inward rectifier potassium channel
LLLLVHQKKPFLLVARPRRCVRAEAEEAEIIITVTGLDNVTSQIVHASATYGPETILWHRRFANIVGYTNDGRRVVDYRRFHAT